MDQKQKIFNLIAKTAKTQLSATRKVKFAIADEAAEALRQLDLAMSALEEMTISSESRTANIVRMLEDAIGLSVRNTREDSMQAYLDSFDEAFGKANDVADKFKQAAESLGIDPYDSDAFRELVEAIEQSAQVTYPAMLARDQENDLDEILGELEAKI